MKHKLNQHLHVFVHNAPHRQVQRSLTATSKEMQALVKQTDTLFFIIIKVFLIMKFEIINDDSNIMLLSPALMIKLIDNRLLLMFVGIILPFSLKIF